MPRIEYVETSGGFLAFIVRDDGGIRHVRHGRTIAEAIERVMASSLNEQENT